MANDDEIIRVGADFTTFDKAVDKSAAKMDNFRGTIAKVDKVRPMSWAPGHFAAAAKAADTASGGLKRINAESEKLEKIGSLIGPQLGGIVQLFSKVGKTAGAGPGGATFALAGFAIALASVAKIGSTVVDVYANIADYQDQLAHAKAVGLITAEEVQNVEKASIAYSELWRSIGDFQVSLAGDFSQDFSAFSLGLDYLLSRIEGFDATEATARAKEFYNTVNGISNSDYGDMDAWLREHQGAPMKVVSVDDQNAKDKAEADAKAKAQEAAARRLAAEKAQSIATANTWIWLMDTIDAETAATAKAEIETWMWLGDQIDAENKSKTDKAIDEMNREHNAFVESAEARVNAEADAQAKIKAEKKKATDDGIAIAGAFGSVLTGIATEVTAAQVDATEEGTKAHRKALYDQFVAEKAAALVSIAINTAVGASQDIARGGVVGIALGVATIAAGIAQAGIVLAKQPPKLHVGGLAPDEEMAGSYIRRNNEARYEITAEGQRRISREDVSRANAGLDSREANMTFILSDGRPLAYRRFAGTTPTVGFAMRAVR